MCRVPVKLRELVKQRLAAAAEEIFELLERTIAEYEEELVSKYQEQRQQGALFSPVVPEAAPHPETPEIAAVQTLNAEWGVSEPAHVKKEKEKESSSQEALHSDIIRSQLCSCKKREKQLSESEEVSGVSRTQGAWSQPVPLLPPGGTLLHHNQTVDCPCPEQDWPQPSVPLSPPGGALLHHNKRSAHADQYHRGVSKCHVCTNCGKTFSARSLLVHHIQVHTRKKPFSCSVCGKSFSRNSNLQSHMSVHTGEKPFRCSVCGKRFSRKGNLQTHMVVHTGQSPFICSVCGKRFSRKDRLQRHACEHWGESIQLRSLREISEIHTNPEAAHGFM